ncbi:MAG: DUF6858 family protein [Pseudomonadota bacterium]
MKQTLLEEKVPVYLLEIDPSECRFDSVEEIADHFRAKIEAHHSACYIASFDHFAHTSSLPNGQIAEDIRAAINIVFCFGLTLPEPVQLANRPRSIGICETKDRFIISFMECPMPVANAVLEKWAKSLYTPQKNLQTA